MVHSMERTWIANHRGTTRLSSFGKEPWYSSTVCRPKAAFSARSSATWRLWRVNPSEYTETLYHQRGLDYFSGVQITSRTAYAL